MIFGLREGSVRGLQVAGGPSRPPRPRILLNWLMRLLLLQCENHAILVATISWYHEIWVVTPVAASQAPEEELAWKTNQPTS